MSDMDETSLSALIEGLGLKIRELKTSKADPEVIKNEVNALLTQKLNYKMLTGKDYVSAAPAPSPKKKEIVAAPAAKQGKSKGEAKTAVVDDKIDLSTLTLFCGSANADDVLRCVLASEVCNKAMQVAQTAPSAVAPRIPFYPALVVPSIASSSGASCKMGTVIFGATAVCRYLALDTPLESSADNLLELLDGPLSAQSKDVIDAVLNKLESEQQIGSLPLALNALFPTLKRSVSAAHPYLTTQVQAVEASTTFTSAQKKITTAAPPAATGASKKASKKEKTAAVSSAGPSKFTNEDVVRPVLGAVDWTSAGLMSSLKLVFDAAITAAFPQITQLSQQDADMAKLGAAVITRCGNPAFGDFQCNNAMSLSKALKSLSDYAGPVSPKDIADRIICALPENPIISATTSAPNGFINITLAGSTLIDSIASIIQSGVKPPALAHKKVLVDFSSPNIAKEMHVGHLRSTIIGDCVCRLLEFCNFDVQRVNHVGDWGTQFGMLITYLQEAFPDILTNPPNISDLTQIYKASKKRFDEDAAFKELSRQNVVRLQSGDAACRSIWLLLCEISRGEFQRVYDALDVQLTEVGESFYNPLIPGTLTEMEGVSIPNTRDGDSPTRPLVETEEGMLLVKLDHFTIPLILRKSDGGYGYDSTDMAALKYRTNTLKRDWLIYITDAGQAPHFHMCFDAARTCNWLDGTRADHIGFGVVCGDDGKRFKTRSSETVRLIDLLDAARDRMRESLQVRADEGKSPLTGEELESAARIIGYGAVKYFDLKQNPNTNYIFSYDRMLDTKGDTAVYLLFAYARLASILRKASEERGYDLTPLYAQAPSLLSLAHPAERALAFELLQLGDVIKSVIEDLLPNRLCDYLKNLAVVFTDFVTKCHVLNAENGMETVHSRLLLCEATRRVMAQCFQLLGIGTLERI